MTFQPISLALLALSFCSLLRSGQDLSNWSKADWNKADHEIVRLAPSRFPELPSPIRHELDRRGCTVPQPWAAKTPLNVVHGRLFSNSEVDWAVLCSIDQISTILVFQSGSPRRVTELSPRKDVDYLQGEGNDHIGYSRAILVAGRHIIAEQLARDGQKPMPVAHDGISDEFVGKASETLYYCRGKWVHLTGSD